MLEFNFNLSPVIDGSDALQGILQRNGGNEMTCKGSKLYKMENHVLL